MSRRRSLLADTTIAENIAFGVLKDQIDVSRMKAALRERKLLDLLKVVQRDMKRTRNKV